MGKRVYELRRTFLQDKVVDTRNSLLVRAAEVVTAFRRKSDINLNREKRGILAKR